MRWALFLFALSFTAFAVQSGDALMYLALARDFILTGEWRQIDPYLYSLPGGTLVWWHEYLSYLIFYGAWWTLGYAGLTLVKVLVLSAMFYVALNSEPRARNGGALWIALFMLAILAGSFRYIERSSMFSDLFTLGLAATLLKTTRPSRKFFLGLAGFFWLWIQLHPGFVAGLIFLGVWCLWELYHSRVTREFYWLALTPAALLLNPLGFEGALYPFQFAFNEARTLKLYNFEWMPAYHPAFRFAPETLAFWILSLASLILLLRARALKTLGAVFALIAFALSAQTVRFVPWSSLLLLICIKPYAELTRVRLDRPWLRRGIAILLFAVAAKNLTFGYMSSSGQRLPRLGLDPKFFPSTTIEFLKQRPIPGRLYNSHDFGSALVWNGIRPIFHHGFVTDMQFYKGDVMGALGTRERFLELADKYGWTMLLVDKFNGYREMHRILSPIPEWKIVAEDEAAYLIYKMPDPPHAR